MQRLLLIKHSLPVIDSTVPAAEWVLSEDGRQRCIRLAKQVAEYSPQVVVCSQEPKASETGRLVAEQLGIRWVTAPDLHEHQRPLATLLPRDRFEAAVEAFFANPNELCFGAETALEAQTRFVKGLEAVLVSYPDQTVAVVAHGTVISLFVALKTGLAAFPVWKKLGLPSLVVLTLPDFGFERMLEDVC